MAKNKTSQVKRALTAGIKHNRRVPVFVIAKTKRSFSRNQMRRYWRARKLRLNAGNH